MTFSKQLLLSCVLGLALGATSGLAKAEPDLKDFNLEPFKVVCVKNSLYLVWEHRDLVVQIKGIFCSNTEYLVNLPKVTNIL
jgi:hypothetical protein